MSTKTKTPAEIPAETTAAHRSQYEPTLHLDAIHPHPKNIRHNATADEALVESIRESGIHEPLIVAPHPDSELGGFILIAGHRRLDGARKAGHTSAPAIVRYDLTDEADQVALMLVENGRRADLTPLEEAEGYGQLRFDFGWKPGQIAKAAGHSVDTINKRLKLLKLDQKVKKSVDAGQLNIEDALAMSELPAAEQKKVAKTAGTGSFRWELSQARERVKKRRVFDQLVAKLDSDGVPKKSMPKSTGLYGLNHADHGMTRLQQTFSADPNQHDSCLAYVVVKGWDDVDEVHYVCTDVPAHDEQLDEQRRQQRLEEEQRQREATEREEAHRIARQLRLDAVVEAIKPGIKLDPTLTSIVRTLAPWVIRNLDDRALEYYFDHLQIPDGQRWAKAWHDRKKHDVERFGAYIEQLLNGPAYGVLRALILAIAVDRIEDRVVPRIGYASTSSSLWERAGVVDVLSYLSLLESIGHTLTPVDLEIQAVANGASPAEEPES